MQHEGKKLLEDMAFEEGELAKLRDALAQALFESSSRRISVTVIGGN